MKRGERLAAWVRGLGVTDKAIRPNHAWRHMFRTRGYSAGVPDSALEAIMGHAPVNVAGSYGNWQLNDLKREIDKLPRFEV
jgi:integrase